MQYLTVGYTCEPFTAIQVADVEDHNVNEGVAVGTANFGTPKNWIFSPSFFPKINFFGINSVSTEIRQCAQATKSHVPDNSDNC